MVDFSLRSFGRSSCRFLIPCGLASIVPLAAMVVSTQAEPVTFAFEAEITSIDRSSDATFDLPANATIGDDLSGLLQFEPIGFNFGPSDADSSLRVNLGTEVFSVARAPLTTQLQAYTGARVIGTLPFYLTRNTIGVGCTDIGSCAAALSSPSNGLELANLSLELSGSIVQETPGGGLIAWKESLGDADVWNRLPDRRLRMEFTSNTDPGSISLEAVIGPMVAIPEPSGFLLMMLGIVSLTRQFGSPGRA